MASARHDVLAKLTMAERYARSAVFDREPGLNVRPKSVSVDDDFVTVKLSDRRVILVPTATIPRLLHASAAERANVELMHNGIMWPDVEADVSIRGLLLGLKDGENPECFAYWLDNRRRGKRVTIHDWIEQKHRAEMPTRKTNRTRATLHA